jgi:non-heme chloroperoxidase
MTMLPLLTGPASAATPISDQDKGTNAMSTITTKDGAQIFYKDWGHGQPIVFHHGWPLSSDDWDTQMLFFLQNGYRVIGIDRRGHGRSSQVSEGHDMDHYAADAADVVDHLDLRNAVHIGHSMGGGEVARYVARHGKGRVAKAVLMSAVTPLMLKTASNPDGLPCRRSTSCAPAWRPIGRNSTATFRQARSMGSIARARRRSKGRFRIGGARA